MKRMKNKVEGSNISEYILRIYLENSWNAIFVMDISRKYLECKAGVSLCLRAAKRALRRFFGMQSGRFAVGER